MKCAVVALLVLVTTPVLGHTGVFALGMYCRDGASNVDSPNTNTVVNPLYGLSKKDWWMQADRGCSNYPPPAGEFLELPVGKSFIVELAFNRAFTTLSYDGKYVSDWPDGKQHPEDWNGFAEDPREGCIQGAGGALHVQNQGNATGTAFAISYNSNLDKVTMENLVVFTVAEHTPWKRLTTYQVPKDLPPCPPGGCHCAYGWSPNGCGQRNVYLQPFKCNVIGSTSNKQLEEAKPPVYCKDDVTKCTKGAKQVIIHAQLDGNNVTPLPGKSPGYNLAWGFAPGAQNDIFLDNTMSSMTSTSASKPIVSSTEVVPSASARITSVYSSTASTISFNRTWNSVYSAYSASSSIATSIVRGVSANNTHSGADTVASPYISSALPSVSLSYDSAHNTPASVASSISFQSPIIRAPSLGVGLLLSSLAHKNYATSSSSSSRITFASSSSVAMSSAIAGVSYASSLASTFATRASSAIGSSAINVASSVPSVKRPKHSHRPRPRPLPPKLSNTPDELANFQNFIDAAWARWQRGHGIRK